MAQLDDIQGRMKAFDEANTCMAAYDIAETQQDDIAYLLKELAARDAIIAEQIETIERKDKEVERLSSGLWF